MIGHGQPYVHVTSSKHGWLVESGCLEPARCFSSRSKLDSPWCSHGALLFTLVCTVPTFIDLRITKRREILHKTSIDMEDYGRPCSKTNHLQITFCERKIMFVFDWIHWLQGTSPSSGACCRIFGPGILMKHWGFNIECSQQYELSLSGKRVYLAHFLWQFQWGK